MIRLSMDVLASIVAELMGEMSYREASKKWGVPHMTLYGLVNPKPGEHKPPSRDTLLAIAEDDPAKYRRLALAAYGLVTDPAAVERVPATA